MAKTVQVAASRAASKSKSNTFAQRFVRDFLMNKYLYVMMIPVLAYYVIFHYTPMYGAIIAFKDYIRKVN